MTLPEAMELLSYLADNPTAARILALVHKVERKKPEANVNVDPAMLFGMAPGGNLSAMAMRGLGNPLISKVTVTADG